MSILSSHAPHASGKRSRQLRSLLFASTALSASLSGAQAQPVFDGTTGNQAPGTIVIDTIDVSQGTRAGGNVFHSFSSFSIPAGQTVTFTDQNPTTPVNNIINRVTGTDISEINGTLRSIIPGANFYLINPNGIMMGSGSVIDVPASLYLSTADELRFENGTIMQAKVGSSSFTSGVPSSFGFTNATVGPISITGATIVGKPGANMIVVGGNITLEHGPEPERGARLTTVDGDIAIVAVGGGSASVMVDLRRPGTTVTSFGDIRILGGKPQSEKVVLKSISTIAASATKITLLGRNIDIEHSEIGAPPIGGFAPDILVSAIDEIQLIASKIASESLAGITGDIVLQAENISLLEGSSVTAIQTFTSSGGFGGEGVPIPGSITVSSGTLLIAGLDDGGNPSTISVDSRDPRSTADAGVINIDVDSIEITDGGLLSAIAFGSGDAGTITVCCGTSFRVSGTGSEVVAGTAAGSTGDAGRIFISSKEVTLTDGGRMTVASEGAGRGGEILVRARTFTASDPSRLTEGRGDAEAAGLATLSGEAGTSSMGAGRIMIEAGIFNLFDGAVITTDTFGSTPAGSISLRASELNIKGEQTLVSSRARGLSGADAGDIDIGTVNFTLSDGASFSTLAQSGGGGNIKFAWNGTGRINNATVKTDVLGGAGGGGTITFGGTVELLDFDTLFQRLCGDLATSFATYEGLRAYDPKSTATPVLLLNNATLSASAQQGAGGTVVVSPQVVVISNVDLPSDFNVASLTGPDGSVIAPAPFVPPAVVIVPERNVTTRCNATRRQNALTDGLTGRMSVGADPSALLPAGPGDAERTLEAVAQRLCAEHR